MLISFTTAEVLSVNAKENTERAYLTLSCDTITEDMGTVTITPHFLDHYGRETKNYIKIEYMIDSVCAQIKTNADSSATVTGMMDGSATVTAIITTDDIYPDNTFKACATITVTNQTPRKAENKIKYMSFGNSIQRHGVSTGIGWKGNWGMAASSKDKDYVHRIMYYLESKYGKGTVEHKYGIAPNNFETAIPTSEKNADFSRYAKSFAKSVSEYGADIVTLQFGENGGAADKYVYANAMTQVIKEIQQTSPDTIIVISTPFWSGNAAGKTIGTKMAAQECGIRVALVNELGTGTNARENMAWDSEFVMDAIDGVKDHPGDTGMENIAKMFFEQINIELSANERTVYTEVEDWENPFSDIAEDAWYYNGVKYVCKNGIMNGTSSETFSPDETLTRAMAVTVLWRMENEPETKDSQLFLDVPAGQWYTKAVAWAAHNNIVNGYGNGYFGTDDCLTREQIALILHRYAKHKGYDVSVGENTNILSYDDFSSISEYAIEAMQYACGCGLLKKKTEATINPKDYVTRAELATILQRFIAYNTKSK